MLTSSFCRFGFDGMYAWPTWAMVHSARCCWGNSCFFLYSFILCLETYSLSSLLHKSNLVKFQVNHYHLHLNPKLTFHFYLTHHKYMYRTERLFIVYEAVNIFRPTFCVSCSPCIWKLYLKKKNCCEAVMCKLFYSWYVKKWCMRKCRVGFFWSDLKSEWLMTIYRCCNTVALHGYLLGIWKEWYYSDQVRLTVPHGFLFFVFLELIWTWISSSNCEKNR